MARMAEPLLRTLGTDEFPVGNRPWQDTATSRQLYTRLEEVEVSGLRGATRFPYKMLDFSGEDISLFLPLWPGIPALPRAAGSHQSDAVCRRAVWPALWHSGLPVCQPPEGGESSDRTRPASPSISLGMCSLARGCWPMACAQKPLNSTARFMAAVIKNLKEKHAFFRAYHAETGAGLGERNALQGLAPLGLFLDVLGVTIHSPRRLTLSGKNPFPLASYGKI